MAKRVFIIGGGSSLKGFDFKRLENEFTIACNVAFIDIKPTILVWIDGNFYEKYKNQIDKLDCLKFANIDSWRMNFKEDIQLYKPVEEFYGKEGLEKGIYVGKVASSLTGIAAISIAVALGYEPIYLLGFDGDNLHYHDRYDKPSEEISLKNDYYKTFKDYKIFNCFRVFIIFNQRYKRN